MISYASSYIASLFAAAAAAAVQWPVFPDSNLKIKGYNRSYLPDIMFAKIYAGPEGLLI